MIKKNHLELLIFQINFDALFRAFNVMYDHHDAKFVFFWAIKFLIFIDALKKLILSRDFYWIKSDNLYMLKNFNTDLKKSVFFKSCREDEASFWQFSSRKIW
jgi:hypothetical protein